MGEANPTWRRLIEGESAVDVRDILFWSQDGQYLVIPDEKDFEERVCRIVFSQSKIANFVSFFGRGTPRSRAGPVH